VCGKALVPTGSTVDKVITSAAIDWIVSQQQLSQTHSATIPMAMEEAGHIGIKGREGNETAAPGRRAV